MLLHCISEYPAKPSDYCLGRISMLRERYGCQVGLSDHTLSNNVAIAATVLGVPLIEKHFIADKTIKSADSSFSIDPDGLKSLIECTEEIHLAMRANPNAPRVDRGNIEFRRSLFWNVTARKGEVVTRSMIKSRRPGVGISPNMFERIIGNVLKKDVATDAKIELDDIF